MLVLTDAKISTVPGNYFEIIQGDMEDMLEFIADGHHEVASRREVIEKIQGIRFTRPDGEQIVLGCDKSIQDLLGMQHKAWLALHDTNDQLAFWAREYRSDRDRITARVDGIMCAPWWQRLKWVFTGVTS